MRWRVVLRIPDGPEVPRLLRGATTLFASMGEGSVSDEVPMLERAVADAVDRFDDLPAERRERVTIDAGAMFGPRGRPQAQRIYTAGTRADLLTLLDRIAAGEQ